jgi:Peptidase family M28
VLHILLALAGGAVPMRRPKLGAAALTGTIVSAVGDSNASFHLLRRVTKRAVTHNVLSREQDGKPATLVLLAHYDAAKKGRLFDPKALARRVRLGRRLGLEVGLFEPFTWSLLGLLALALVRAAGAPRRALSAARIPPMLTLAAHIPLLLEVRASAPVPGAHDHASGVATILRLAERHGGRLRHHDVWVLFTGAEEGLLLGVREWVRRHKHELDPQRTTFLNINEAGYGTVRYATNDSRDSAPPTARACFSSATRSARRTRPVASARKRCRDSGSPRALSLPNTASRRSGSPACPRPPSRPSITGPPTRPTGSTPWQGRRASDRTRV